MLSLWGLDGDRASDGGGRPDMTTRGVDAVLAHLAKLPPQESLTLAEQRAQYERAERAFPVPADVTVERVTAPVAPAEWLARSEEHTSELQSRLHLVCRLLLEKKKKKRHRTQIRKLTRLCRAMRGRYNN